MQKTAFLLPALSALLCAPAGAAPREDGEARLAQEVEGRIAGDPVRCLPLRALHSSRIIDRTAIVYDAGTVLYVNRPRGGAESLDRWDTLLTRSFGSQLCSRDTVHLLDSGTRMQTGFVQLGEFVPYRKPKGGTGR